MNRAPQVVAFYLPWLFMTLAASASSITTPRYQVTSLGARYATGINNAGQVVGSFQSIDDNLNRGPIRIFVYDGYGANAGNVTEYGFDRNARNVLSIHGGSPGTLWNVGGINDAGTIVGTVEVENQTDANLRPFQIADGQMTDLAGTTAARGRALGINASGTVIGTTRTDGDEQPATYVNGGVSALPSASLHGTAEGINDHGQVVGRSYETGHAYLSDASGTPRDLGTLGGAQSAALAINNRGEAVGHSEIVPGDYATHAFLWRDDVMTDLGVLSEGRYREGSFATAINDQGRVVGQSTFDDSTWQFVPGVGSHAFLYSDGTMYDLNELVDRNSPWVITEALGINNLGQIIAWATDLQTFDRVSLLLTPDGMPAPAAPVPEPGTAAILASGLLAMGGWRAARRRAGNQR